jgi:hypothetical protein
VGHVGVTDMCSFLIASRGERARAGRVPRPQVQGEPWCTGDGRSSSRGGGGGGDWHQTMADRPGELAGRPTIFTDGTLAPPLTSLVASKSFSRSIDATKAHDMTMAGGASFNGGIFLAEAVVDRALKGSMVGERMNKSFGREVRKKEMS